MLSTAARPATMGDLDLRAHLALVSHVVREFQLRVPSHYDRTIMFGHGAMGLVIAARRHDSGAGDFSRQALRAIRASIIGSLRSKTAPPSDVELAGLLAVEVQFLTAARCQVQETDSLAVTPGPTAAAAPAAPAPKPDRPVRDAVPAPLRAMAVASFTGL